MNHDNDDDDDGVQVLGWGLLSEDGDQPSVLQKVTVPFLPYGNVFQLLMMIFRMIVIKDNADDHDAAAGAEATATAAADTDADDEHESLQRLARQR